MPKTCQTCLHYIPIGQELYGTIYTCPINDQLEPCKKWEADPLVPQTVKQIVLQFKKPVKLEF
jgi:hypothetical protein